MVRYFDLLSDNICYFVVILLLVCYPSIKSIL